MKALNFAVAVLAGGLLVGGVASHAQSTHVKAAVPFDFMVGKTMLPAGEYNINPLNANQAIAIRSTDDATTVMTIANSCGAVNRSEEAKLVFHRYDEEYFLSQVWLQSSDCAAQLPTTDRERELLATHQVPDQIFVAELTSPHR